MNALNEVEIERELKEFFEFDIPIFKNIFSFILEKALTLFSITSADKTLYDDMILDLQAEVPPPILKEVQKDFLIMLQFSRSYNRLRKERAAKVLKEIPTNAQAKIELENELSQKSGCMIKVEKLPFSLDRIRSHTSIRIMQVLLESNCYLNRDALFLWIQDLYKKHMPDNYFKPMSSTLFIIEKHFPELFKYKFAYDYENRHEFRVNMCKRRKKLESMQSELKDLGPALERK